MKSVWINLPYHSTLLKILQGITCKCNWGDVILLSIIHMTHNSPI